MKLFFCVLLATICLYGFSQDKLPETDHAVLLKKLNKATLEKGKQLYQSSCIACHGANGTASLAQARSFSKDKLRFGNKPYDMWRTVTNGAGAMPAQSWLSPAERYYVIQYIRETFIKESNLSQYFNITNAYLATLPKAGNDVATQQQIVKNEALKGNLKYGQEWFQHHTSDYGPAIHSQLKNVGSGMLTVRLSNNVMMSYNLLRMNTAAVWKGSLNLTQTKYKNYRGEGPPAVQGSVMDGLNMWQWTLNDKIDSLLQSTGKRSPLPTEWMDYHGHYAYNKGVILSYAVMGREVLEYPQSIALQNNTILSQTLRIAPGSEQKIYIGQMADGKKSGDSAIRILTDPVSKRFVAAAVIGYEKNIRYSIDEQNRMVLTIPQSADTIVLNVLRISGSNGMGLPAFKKYVALRSTEKKELSFAQMIQGGKAQWAGRVTTVGMLNANIPHFDPIYSTDADRTDPAKAVLLQKDYPYTVDNIGLPFNNPWNAWVRPSCLGFKNNGDLVVGTYTGDVWVASGIDNILQHVSWQRIAAGLYEPMGLKVVNDKIFVTTHNGIVLLHDLNGDGETDFYENFYADKDVSSFFHSFNFGLETDSKGNFYYAKAGEYTDNKDPGNVIKVSPDGKHGESIATGFRTDNGITLTPDDKIYVSDNQGNWMPANKINLVKQGGYYGYVPNLLDESGGWSPDGKHFTKEQAVDGVIKPELVKVPEGFDQPALWLPQEIDNSPGGGVWSDRNWGPLGNTFIHSSYGRGWLYAFYPQQIDTTTQGAILALPFQFEAGVQRVAVNPVDKNIYTTGLTGWDDGVATKYGVLSRVRYKGGDGHLMTGVETVKGGIQMHFNCALDKDAVKDLSHYNIIQYNYKWTSNYGSPNYSVKYPDKEGVDTIMVKEAVVSEDGHSLVLKVPEIGPAQTMRLRFEIKASDGTTIKDVVYFTIHKVPE
ncbi:MAG: c-type cytochrome [Agriterribacter sp.]